VFNCSGPALTAHGSLDLKQEIQIQSLIAGAEYKERVASQEKIYMCWCVCIAGAGYKELLHRKKKIYMCWCVCRSWV
jgi:hypothetical protein